VLAGKFDLIAGPCGQERAGQPAAVEPGGSIFIIRRRATYTGSAAMWSRWVCVMNHVAVAMKPQGCEPRSKPSLSSGIRQQLCTAARE
jgi:hypothetical protein